MFQSLPTHVKADDVKSQLYIPKIILNAVFLWPETEWIWTTAYYKFLFPNIALFVFSLLWNIATNRHDMSKIATTLFVFILLIMAISKLVNIVILKQYTKSIINQTYNFWPSNSQGEEMQNLLTNKSRLLKKIYYFIAVLTISADIMFTVISCIYSHVIPSPTNHPFKPSSVVLNGLVDIWFIIIASVIIISNLGCDILSFSILSNCSAQYALLGAFFRRGMQDIVIESSMGVDTKKLECHLLRTFIRHHNQVFSVVEHLGKYATKPYSLGILLIVPCICVGFFTFQYLTAIEGYRLMLLIVVCLTLIITYAVLCTEVSEQSMALADEIFYSPWYEVDNIYFKRCLVLLIRRCHQPAQFVVCGCVPFGQPEVLRILKALYAGTNIFSTVNTKMK